MGLVLRIACNHCDAPRSDPRWFHNKLGDACHYCADGMIGGETERPVGEPPPAPVQTKPLPLKHLPYEDRVALILRMIEIWHGVFASHAPTPGKDPK